jgi:transcription initiation factor TFIID TATA-box-binding protein
MTRIIVENIVAFAEISDSLDIELLAEKLPDASFDPDEFAGLTVKSKKPRVAILILPSGKIVSTGAKYMGDVEDTIKKIVNEVKKAGINVKKNYKIQIDNIIASTKLNKEINLRSIANGLILKNVDYEPEQFPGLIYRLNNLGAMLLLFSSGKLICIGTKKLDDATSAVNILKEELSASGVL